MWWDEDHVHVHGDGDHYDFFVLFYSFLTIDKNKTKKGTNETDGVYLSVRIDTLPPKRPPVPSLSLSVHIYLHAFYIKVLPELCLSLGHES